MTDVLFVFIRVYSRLIKSHLLYVLNLTLQHHRCRPRDSAVLADAPEVHHHEGARDDRYRHAVPDIRAKQRVRVDNRSTQQAETHIVEWRHAELRAKGSVVAEQWC